MKYGRNKMYLRLTIVALFLLLTVGCKPTPIELTPAPEPTIEDTEEMETAEPDGRSETTLYTVQPGDTLSSIAKSFHLATKMIAASNSDLNLISLDPGMELRIPPQEGVYYTWQSSDTLVEVAQRFEVDPQVILDWHENTGKVDANGNYLNGAILFIPGGKIEFIDFTPPPIATP